MIDVRGARVLLPRPEAGDPIAAAVRAAGGTVLVTALVHVEPLTDGLEGALGHLAAGAHSWFAVTSATTVRLLAQGAARRGTTLAALTAGVRVAAVGPATLAALAEHGVGVELAGAGSADALLSVWPDAGHPAPGPGGDRPAVLLPRSALGAPTLPEGLRARGWQVTDLPCYTTRTAPTADPAVTRALAEGALDVVLLTSGSTARALAELYGPPPPTLRVCAIGHPTAAAAAAVGLRVDAVAAAPTPAGLVQAAVRALAAPAPAGPGPVPARRTAPMSAPAPARRTAPMSRPAPEEYR